MRILIFLFVLISFVSCYSNENHTEEKQLLEKEVTTSEPSLPTEEVIIPSKITVQATVENLRIRDNPTLMSNTIGKIDKNYDIYVFSQSKWNQSISGYTGPWLKVSNNDIVGWIFGGMTGVTYYQLEKIEMDQIQLKEIINEKSVFNNLKSINTESFAELSVPIFGIEAEYMVPDETDYGVFYDDLNEKLIFEKTDDFSNFHIKMVTNSGIEYSNSYSLNAKNFTYFDPYWDDDSIKREVVLIDFSSYANLPRGISKFYISTDKNNWTYIGELDISPSNFTIANTNDPNPFIKQDSNFILGEEVYFICNSRNSTTLGLYVKNGNEGKNPDTGMYDVYYDPYMVFQKSNLINNNWISSIKMGNDFEPGSYKIAIGTIKKMTMLGFYHLYIDG